MTDLRIQNEEFQQRRERALAAARRHGLRGLLVCARGGGNCRAARRTPITEIFRFQNGKWVY